MMAFKMKQAFFDRPKVVRALKSARRKNLSKAGAFVRQRAKTSIRPAPRKLGRDRKRRYKSRGAKVSAPGNPPFSHTKRLRKLIYFGYDQAADSVVVGPEGIGNSPAPAALEHGGTSKAVRIHKGRRTQRTIRVRRRPFMQPALEKEAPHFPDLWANSIREA